MEMMSKMSESWIVDDDVSSSDGGDLSTWEMIDPSTDSETLDFPLSDSDTESLSFSRSSPPKKKPLMILIDRFGCNFYTHHRRIECHVDDQDDSEEEEEDDDDVDDELVPKGVGARLERNRMRKLGKREYSKMARSKKLPLVYNRPGCVRGKHGLGLKHSLLM